MTHISMDSKTNMFDVEVQDHGSIHIVLPLNDSVEEWLEEHTDGMWAFGGLVVEPRYTVDLLLGMQEDGFNVPLEKKN